MTICVNCQGQGHSTIIGDNDIECKVCGGTGEQPANTTAAIEPLSAESELRLHLAMYDELFSTVSTHMTDAEWQPFMAVQDEIYNNPDEKYHMLLDLLDASRAETAALREQVAMLTASRDEDWRNAYQDGYNDGLKEGQGEQS